MTDITEYSKVAQTLKKPIRFHKVLPEIQGYSILGPEVVISLICCTQGRLCHLPGLSNMHDLVVQRRWQNPTQYPVFYGDKIINFSLSMAKTQHLPGQLKLDTISFKVGMNTTFSAFFIPRLPRSSIHISLFITTTYQLHQYGVVGCFLNLSKLGTRALVSFQNEQKMSSMFIV